MTEMEDGEEIAGRIHGDIDQQTGKIEDGTELEEEGKMKMMGEERIGSHWVHDRTITVTMTEGQEAHEERWEIIPGGDGKVHLVDLNRDTELLANLCLTGWIQAGDHNVIMVDLRGPASNILYVPARNAVPEVGQIVAHFIDFLVQQGANAGSMEVAGHSLGAHVAGIAGNRAAATIGRLIVGDKLNEFVIFNNSSLFFPGVRKSILKSTSY
ncbi:uncharacterized protein LOC124803201 [Schistocerca piceifrons]|uniref:uncharacterized protein LOC124803201 n=1 Tax=Schistocerca piceifrons TaxID=274613 RepID=UPI001F5F4B29|nr:uncharacterized protein LOC124803201 [Schistocerca piceifrons]